MNDNNKIFSCLLSIFLDNGKNLLTPTFQKVQLIHIKCFKIRIGNGAQMREGGRKNEQVTKRTLLKWE